MRFTQFIPLFLLLQWSLRAESRCKNGCPLALASYHAWPGVNITYIAQILDTTEDVILSYNPSIPDKFRLPSSSRLNIPFSCQCINGRYLGHVFQYKVNKGETYSFIANTSFANLTSVEWLTKTNSYPPDDVPANAVINVNVNCSCGDSKIDKKYGLFLTYPLRPEDNLTALAQAMNTTEDLLRAYNPNANFSAGKGIVFVPAKDKDGTYPSLKSSAGLSGGGIAGIVVAVISLLILLSVLYFFLMGRRKMKNAMSLEMNEVMLARTGDTHNVGKTVDKSMEFSYKELARATDNFSMANKIGSGGFGDVYFAELRGEKAAIKKMDMQASKEFLAELKVLTRVHHLNLVRLIGYCVEKCLFLVYEYVENGNLSQHLRNSERDLLPWSTRVQIALDSARGLEYIHEHTVPVYVHRDIKSANILIDKCFRAKVADFGMAKLTEVGATAGLTRLVGTFGYMPPEYAQFGDVSPKVDVYAFGVVLYELISAKPAVVRGEASEVDLMGLVGVFENAFDHVNSNEIRKLVDPRLGDNFPFDSVVKMAQLAKSCTQENPDLRPTMRSVVVALMTLSSKTEEWGLSAADENHGLYNMSAR